MTHSRGESTISTVSISQQEPEIYRIIRHTLQEQKNVVNDQLNELLQNLQIRKTYNSKIIEACQVFIRDFLSIPSQAFDFSALSECLKQIQYIFMLLQQSTNPQEYEVDVVEMIVQSITNLASLISGCILQSNNTATVSQVENQAIQLPSIIDNVPKDQDSILLLNFILNSFNTQFVEEFLRLNPDYKPLYIECKKKQKFSLFNKQQSNQNLYQQLSKQFPITEIKDAECYDIIQRIQQDHDNILTHIHKRIHQIQQDCDSLDSVIRAEYNLQPTRFPSNVSPMERTLQYFLDVIDMYRIQKNSKNEVQLSSTIMNRLSYNLSYGEERTNEYNENYDEDASFEENVPYIIQQTQQNDEIFSEALNNYYNENREYDRPLFISALADQYGEYQPQQSLFTLICEGQFLVGISYLIEQVKSPLVGLQDAEQLLDIVKILSLILNNAILCSYGDKGMMNKIKQLQYKQIYYKNIKQISNQIYSSLQTQLNSDKILKMKRGFINLKLYCLCQVLNIHYYKNMMLELHGKHTRIQSMAQVTALQYVEKERDEIITSEYSSYIPTHQLDDTPLDAEFMTSPIFTDQLKKPDFRIFFNYETIDVLTNTISLCVLKLYLLTYFEQFNGVPQKFKQSGEFLGVLTKNFKNFNLSQFVDQMKDLQVSDSSQFIKLVSDLQQKLLRCEHEKVCKQCDMEGKQENDNRRDSMYEYQFGEHLHGDDDMNYSEYKGSEQGFNSVNENSDKQQKDQKSFNSEWSFNQSNQSKSSVENEQSDQHEQNSQTQHNRQHTRQNQEQKQQQISQEQKIKQSMKLSNFTPLQKIASGGYGTVILARNEVLQKNLAIKIIKKEDIMRKNAVNRIRIEQQIYKLLERKRQRNINIPKANYHDFIVRFYGSFKTSTHLFLILEYMAQGDLSHLLDKCGSFEEKWAQQLISEIILALTYIHACSICYNDLKPENILLDDQGHIKFTDFGISTVTLQKQFQKPNKEEEIQDQQFNIVKTQTYVDLAQLTQLTEEQNQIQKGIKHLTCTPYYAAPELINGETPSYASDWWAVGVMLYQFIFGVLPFDGNTPEEVFQQILNHDPDFYEDEQVCSSECIDFIKQLMCKNKNQRMQSFKEISLHPWFKNFSWDNLFHRPAVVVPKKKAQIYTPMFEDNTNWVKQLLQGDDSIISTQQTNQVSSYTDQFENFSYVNSKLLNELKGTRESTINKSQ